MTPPALKQSTSSADTQIINTSRIITYYLFKKSGISSLTFLISILLPNQASFHSFSFLLRYFSINLMTSFP